MSYDSIYLYMLNPTSLVVVVNNKRYTCWISHDLLTSVSCIISTERAWVENYKLCSIYILQNITEKRELHYESVLIFNSVNNIFNKSIVRSNWYFHCMQKNQISFTRKTHLINDDTIEFTVENTNKHDLCFYFNYYYKYDVLSWRFKVSTLKLIDIYIYIFRAQYQHIKLYIIFYRCIKHLFIQTQYYIWLMILFYFTAI